MATQHVQGDLLSLLVHARDSHRFQLLCES